MAPEQGGEAVTEPSMPNPYSDEEEGWRTECVCGYVAPWRPTYAQSDKDRTRHFADHARLVTWYGKPPEEAG